MLLLTLEKTGSAAYIPHVDYLRAVIRTIRRAGLAVGYSEGYSPHMLLYFGPPLPVGTESVCELCAAVTSEAPAAFMERYNAVCPDGMSALSAETVQDGTSPSGQARAAEYEISFPGADGLPINEIIKLDKLIAVYTDKDGQKEKDIRGGIYSIVRTDRKDTMKCVLAAGNDNLRADRFLHAAAGFCGIDLKDKRVTVKRTKIYNSKPL